MNSFGINFRLTTFGESHGPAIGGVIDGCPAGWRLDTAEIQRELDLRRPGVSRLTSARREADHVEFLSGVLADGTVLGSPIAFLIRNTDQRSADYEALREVYRPGHADFTYQLKYGVRDHRGGGRASARETASRVVGGAVALQWLRQIAEIRIEAELTQVGSVRTTDGGDVLAEIERVRALGDSVGGVVSCRIDGLPAGVGEPVGDKLQARLAAAMMSINAAKGFEYGDGFAAAEMLGSKANDPMRKGADGRPLFLSNHSGGILGGISTGEPVTFRVAFKPTPSIALPQQTVNHDGNEVEIKVTGRHDPCVALRAVPVVKAMAALTLADLMYGFPGRVRKG
ncbi:MAG: chorismate synthase [Bacteroides sp.]|nr:chorismate synthase [Bacteroides sp.]